ncbi:hypothetical protein [Nevskia soli]|uniref:hypothetical protein n=1 Tax=Nevskia soli TaxID=418856 RepID=UPI0004A77582|nr:hypothetical protein [Nevskia soli]
MSKRRLLAEVENTLLTLDISTSLEEKRHDDLIKHEYRMARRDVEKARVPLTELGMYEQVKAVIDTAEDFLKRRQFAEAHALFYKTYRELMGKSGTDERNNRRYGKKDGQAQNAAMVVTADGVEEWGVLAPDGYAGAFLKSVSTAERDRVFLVANDLAFLRQDVFMAEVDPSEGTGRELAAVFQKLRDAIVRAEPQLQKLGVCRMLLGALQHAESLISEGELAEAGQMLEVVEQAFAGRFGMKAARTGDVGLGGLH